MNCATLPVTHTQPARVLSSDDLIAVLGNGMLNTTIIYSCIITSPHCRQTLTTTAAHLKTEQKKSN